MAEKKTVTIKGAKLWSWQNDFCKAFTKLQPDETLVVKKCRQVGCSFTLTQILFYVALNRPKSTSIYITINNAASRKFFQDMSEMCEKSPLLEKINESTLEMKFTNGSKIYFRSAESKLRSLSCKRGGVLIADECAFLNENIWTQILPFTTVSHANKIVCSTPWSKTGMFYKFCERAMSKDPGYYYIDTKGYDLSKFITQEQKDEYRKILSPQAYLTEIEGEWLDNNSGVFGAYQESFFEPTDKNPVWCGIDFSSSVGGDDTVLVGFNNEKQMCLLYTDNQTADPVERAEKRAEIINEYPSIRRVVCETNSMGSTFISIMKRHLKNPNVIAEFSTTNTSKKDIIENLIALLGKKQITLLKDAKLDYEFAIYQLVTLKGGNYTYNADTKVINSHDDIVMATALACKSINSNQGNYSFGHSTTRRKYR